MMSSGHYFSMRLISACCVFFFFGAPSWAVPTHAGLSLFGQPPKYAPDFSHVGYVSPEAQKGGDISLAAPGTFDTLNPFIITGIPAASVDLAYATLLKTADDDIFTAYPYAAQSYDIKPSVPSITFHIRPQASFYDGSPLTAKDVKFSFEALTTHGSPHFRSLFKEIKSVSVINDHTITFTLSPSANHELPLLIGTKLFILSKKYYQEHDFSKPSLAIPLTSGPYFYQTVDPGHSVTLKRVNQWWGENVPISRYMYNFDQIKFIYFRDPYVAFEAFKKGDIDFRHEMSAKFWAIGYDFPALASGKVIRREIPHRAPTGMLGFMFNTRRAPFDDPRVREALNILFDFEWINKNLFYNHYHRLHSFFTNTPFASEGLPSPEELELLEPFRSELPKRLFTEPYSPTPQDGYQSPRSRSKRALQLLHEAGFIFQRGKLVSSVSHQPFHIDIISSSPAMEKITLSFIKSLKSIGIDVSFRYLDPSQYVERTNQFDFDLVSGGLVPASSHPGTELEDFFGSCTRNIEGSQNLPGIENPVVDALIKRVGQASSLEALIPAAQALDRVLLWNFYFIPKWHTRGFHIAYWDKFNYPDLSPHHSVGFETWWIKKPSRKPLPSLTSE